MMAMSQPRSPGAASPVPPESGERPYATMVIVLHWTIAALILIQIGLGWYMNHVVPDHSAAQARIEGLHISVGLTTLVLILARIGARLVYRAPPLPPGLRGWERGLVGATHALFYVLMLALPLTGWALVSAGPDPISIWGAQWPRLPGLGFLAAPENRPLHHALQDTHTTYLVWIVLANLFLHVAGALKHQFDGHPVLWRMAPFIRPAHGPRP
jgi:cytochrome b561